MLDSPTPDRKPVALLLLVIAGFVDAIGLAETGRYFVSFMSGNTTQAAVHLAYHDFKNAWLPLGLVALFVAGAMIGTLLVEKTGRAAGAALMLVTAALLAGCAFAFVSPRIVIGVMLLPVAMGLVNIITLHRGDPTPGATHATGALVKLGIGLAGLGREAKGGEVALHALMWLALLVGSLIGAFARLRYGTNALFAPVGLLVLLAMFDLIVSFRRRT